MAKEKKTEIDKKKTIKRKPEKCETKGEQRERENTKKIHTEKNNNHAITIFTYR